MFRIFQKIALSSLSVLFCSLLVWILILTNPQWSYAHSTQFDVLTVHHDQPLATGTAEVLNASLKIIKRSPLFQEGMRIQLCLNDGSSYPGFNPLAGLSLAYATLQISTINQCELDFDQNRASASWAINDYETRTYNLTWLLAHEFTHNLQYKRKAGYVIASTLGKINWKLEGMRNTPPGNIVTMACCKARSRCIRKKKPRSILDCQPFSWKMAPRRSFRTSSMH